MMDPEAAHIVLACADSPLTILPWETCIDGEFDITLVCTYYFYYQIKLTCINIFPYRTGA